MKGGVMLATKCDLAEISEEEICYALLCKQALFSLDDIASSIPPAVTNMLQEYADVFLAQIPLGLPPVRERDRASNRLDSGSNFAQPSSLPNQPR